MANKIIVAQFGARHRYAIPLALEQQGILYRLYTNSTRYSFAGKCSVLLEKIGVKQNSLARLSKRIPPIARNKIFTTDRDLFSKFKYKLYHKDDFFYQTPYYFDSLNKKYKSWGIGEADCVYSMLFENLDFLKYAKDKGLKIVVDIFEAPIAYENLSKEISDHPSYHRLQKLKKRYSIGADTRKHYMEDLLLLADYYTVPSSFVMKSLETYNNYDPAKVLFLPYPSSIVPKEYDYKPQKHKLIWVGNDPVRKGIIYCAKAANILKEKYPDLDFHIIGGGTEEFERLPEFQNLNFIGRLNKDELIHEFQTAEAYVFPTLFEGFAGTIIEAASCGCPIITTEAAGTDVDKFPAVYIPTRNVDSIVDAVEKIFTNPNYRDQLSTKTYNYAKSLHLDAYQKNLFEYLKNI